MKMNHVNFGRVPSHFLAFSFVCPTMENQYLKQQKDVHCRPHAVALKVNLELRLGLVWPDRYNGTMKKEANGAKTKTR